MLVGGEEDTGGPLFMEPEVEQENLEAFMLMGTYKEILMSIDNETIINKVAETSALLRRLLML